MIYGPMKPRNIYSKRNSGCKLAGISRKLIADNTTTAAILNSSKATIFKQNEKWGGKCCNEHTEMLENRAASFLYMNDAVLNVSGHVFRNSFEATPLLLPVNSRYRMHRCSISQGGLTRLCVRDSVLPNMLLSAPAPFRSVPATAQYLPVQ